MPQEEFEPTIPVFERVITFQAFVRAAMRSPRIHMKYNFFCRVVFKKWAC
jgi:hypothetical protein